MSGITVKTFRGLKMRRRYRLVKYRLLENVVTCPLPGVNRYPATLYAVASK